ncbi:dipeptide epimerase [candidate division KSB1 bacterium]|nr:dipeptide epimerase [candidate division KSB1 bacterium]
MPLKLKKVFRVANSSKSIADNVLIKLSHDELTGYGEAAPSEFYGENSQTVIATLNSIKEYFSGILPELTSTTDSVGEKIAGNYAAKAAVSIALYDLIGKRLNLPLHQVLGLTQPLSGSLTSVTIGIDSLPEIQKSVEAAEEFPILKVKLGSENDREIIECIRKITDKPLRIDANEGWCRDEAVEKINWLRGEGVELVEQPLPADEIADTAWVRERVSLPIFADESVKTIHDIPKLANAFDGINIKLMKCGGITAALRMIKAARSPGLSIMLGCFIESSIAITAAAHLSAACDYLDLDGHLFLVDDPFTGLQIKRGRIKLPDSPGIGVIKRE